MTDRYEFLKTTQHDGRIVALIADREVLGEGGIASLRKAFNAHATPRVRSGVLTLTETGLKELKSHIEKSADMPKSLAAVTRAMECIEKKKNDPAAGGIVNQVAGTITGAGSVTQHTKTVHGGIHF